MSCTAAPRGVSPVVTKRLASSAAISRVVGCEPGSLGDEDGAAGLSEPVRAAVAEAVRVAEELARAFVLPDSDATAGASG